MASQHGQSLEQFLNERCASLRGAQQQLAQQLSESSPDIAERPEFIREVIRVHEQLQSCESLEANIHGATDNSARVSALNQERLQINHRIAGNLATIRAEPQTLAANLARENVAVLLALHEELEAFCDD